MIGRPARAEYLVVTKKFARRFVMVATSIIGISHRYVVMALRREMHWPRQRKRKFREDRMKTFITILGSALIVAASVQFVAAAQRHCNKSDRVVVRQQPSTINSYAAWATPAQASSYGYAPSYYSGGYSAPAGH
jgi:hypothetical protein